MLLLAGRLRELDTAALAELIRQRQVPPSGIGDHFDLAEALLQPASIHRALSLLDRDALIGLARLAGGDREAEPPSVLHRAAELQLLRMQPEPALYDAVAQQLGAWMAAHPGALDPDASAPPTAGRDQPVPLERTDRLAAELAFAAVTAIAEVLIELDRRPGTALSGGGMASSTIKRLAEMLSQDPATVAALTGVATLAGLTVSLSGEWQPTRRGEQWLLADSGQRWAALATAWQGGLEPDIRHLLVTTPVWGDALPRHARWLYPAAGEELLGPLDREAETAGLLGVAAEGRPSSAGEALLHGDAEGARVRMAALFPSQVEQVYLQRDLTVIAPGPLAPRIDARLRTMAEPESRGLATSYRFSAASMNGAMAAGETAETMRGFLSGIALAGIPQPLDYLISEAAQRFGLLRVGADGEGSYLRSGDAQLLDAVLVDQSLSPLRLRRRDEVTATSPRGLHTVYFSLSDARYPVAAEDGEGRPKALRRRQAEDPPPPGPDPAVELARALHDAVGPAETGRAWLAKQLDLAIRNRIGLVVSVTLPDGGSRDYELEPASVSGGRLRSRDRRSAVERTLPLSSITAVRPAEERAN